jgi:hypothetical protein
VERSVVRSTQGNEIVGAVIAAFGTELNVVCVEKLRMLASWNDAPSAVAPHDLTPNGRCYVLSSLQRRPALAVGRCCASHCAISTISGPTSTSSPFPCCQPRAHSSQTVRGERGRPAPCLPHGKWFLDAPFPNPACTFRCAPGSP